MRSVIGAGWRRGLGLTRWKVTVEMVDVLFKFGQQQFSIGNYAAASDLLYQFRILVSFYASLLIL